MQRYIVGRLLQVVMVLLALTVIIFILTHLSGDPVALMMPQEATPEQWEEMRHKLRLDQPLYVQYGTYLKNLLRGDFGQSYKWQVPALGLVLKRLPATAQLALSALLFSIAVGLPMGIFSAVYRDGLFDRFAKAIALFGQAAPTFWVGIMLILLFAVSLRIFPTSGRGGPINLVLPAITLGLYPIAGLTRLTRSSMLNVLDSEYIKMARIKGSPERIVIWKHALKNASIPVVTFIGVTLGGMLSGTVITETVFAWPGIGKLSVDAILYRDFPTVQAAVFVAGTFFLAINLVIDILYAYLDPRISYG